MPVIKLNPYFITVYDHKLKKTLHKVTYQHIKSKRITAVYKVRSLIEGNLYTFSGEVWSPILHLLNNKSAKIIKFKPIKKSC